MNIQKEIKCLEFAIKLRESALQRERVPAMLAKIPFGLLVFVDMRLGIIGLSLQLAGLIRQGWIYYQTERAIKDFKAEIYNV